jgi:hypothetical protein
MKRTFTLLTAAFFMTAASIAAPDASTGGIRWTMPAGWQASPSQAMRAASYTIPAEPGAEPASCGVFYFGKGQGGTVEDNLTRWAGQFEGAADLKKSERTINGLKVHLITVSGTYLAPGGPGMQSQGKKPGWSLSGAIVEGPEGLVFFKCVGPAKSIAKAQPDIEALYKSIAKAGAAKA